MLTRTLLPLSCVAALAAPAFAQKSGAVSVPVKGDIAFEIALISGDVRVVAGKPGVVEAVGDPDEPLALVRRGNRVVAEAKRGALRSGDVSVRVPPGTDVFVTTVSGDLEVRDIGGNANLHTVSGNIEVSGVRDLSAATVSGDIDTARIKGAVRAQTVSGSATIDSQAGAAARLEFATTSGDFHWRGACASGCRLQAQSLSGTLHFNLSAKSSFELDFESFSGGWNDGMGLADVQESGTIGVQVSGRYGKGAGKIDVNSHSGSVELKKIPAKRSP